MDVGREQIRAELERRMLLFGAVIYAPGKLGEEPVRSQGHVHRVSSHSGWSPAEVYEIWEGAAYVYMQEYAAENPGRCYRSYGQAWRGRRGTSRMGSRSSQRGPFRLHGSGRSLRSRLQFRL